MAFFQVLLAAVSVPCMANTFGVTKPALHAEPVLQSNSWWHLGGFCFGQEDGAPVARLIVRMLWQGQAPLDQSAQVYLASFDGREDKWGVAKRDWDTSSCEQKVAASTDQTLLTKHGGGGIQPQVRTAFAINIHQKTATRDWHYALLVCGNVEAAPLQLRVEAEHGALSIFEARQNFDSSSCPVMPVSWWQHAAEDPLFWVLLFAAAIVSSAGSITIMICYQLKRRKDTRLLSDSRSAAENNDVVIGKPCETPEGEITEGHINATKNAIHDTNVAKEVWVHVDDSNESNSAILINRALQPDCISFLLSLWRSKQLYILY